MPAEQPMLAYQQRPTADDLKPHWPLLASDKLDGIRGVRQWAVVTRSWKEMRSAFAQKLLKDPILDGVDGEFLATDVPVGRTLFHETQSRCNTIGDMRPLTFHAFDLFPNLESRYWNYQVRHDIMANKIAKAAHPNIFKLEQTLLWNYEQLLEYEEQALARYAEGVIIRRPDGLYKFGRSTLNEGWLMKFVQWTFGDAIIEGFEEQDENTNPAEMDAFGRTKRSTHQAGKIGKGVLGAYIARDLETGVVFRCGGGPMLTAATRAAEWAIRDKRLGDILHYRHRPYGVKEAPRFPQAWGIRHPDDMS